MAGWILARTGWLYRPPIHRHRKNFGLGELREIRVRQSPSIAIKNMDDPRTAARAGPKLASEDRLLDGREASAGSIGYLSRAQKLLAGLKWVTPGAGRLTFCCHFAVSVMLGYVLRTHMPGSRHPCSLFQRRDCSSGPSGLPAAYLAVWKSVARRAATCGLVQKLYANSTRSDVTALASWLSPRQRPEATMIRFLALGISLAIAATFLITEVAALV